MDQSNLGRKFKASVFLSLVATSTNLPRRHKDEIKHLIDDYGSVKYVVAAAKSKIYFSKIFAFVCSNVINSLQSLYSLPL